MSRPWNGTGPAVRSCRRAMHLASVDLPPPDSPTSPSVSPARTSRLTSSTACTRATSRARIPFLIGKYFLTCSARRAPRHPTSRSPFCPLGAQVLRDGQVLPGGQVRADGAVTALLLLLRVEVAGIQVAVAELVGQRRDLPAPVEPVRAAGSERAALR